MVITNHKIVNAIVYGIIREIAFEIVTVLSLFLVYICRKPINITKYVNKGVIPFRELSAALNTTWENSGVSELCIYIGTITGDSIAHLVDAAGTRILDIATIRNVINTNIIPDSFKLLIEFVIYDTINTPIFVCLKIKQNCAAKNINTSNEDKSFK